jgi:hypothetical protein
MKVFDTALTARVSRNELKSLTAQAEAANRTRSDYVRGVIRVLMDRRDLRRELEKEMEKTNGRIYS